MLLQYAQNSTDYALTYATNLPIMLKQCLLFLEGAKWYVHITLNITIALPISNQAYLLGDLHADYMDHVLFL